MRIVWTMYLSFFPHYTEHVLQHLWPVISMDAAHLKSCYKGTISIYSGLTGTEQAYIWAFGIKRGNEDFVSWDIFNTLFAQACPCVRIVEERHIYLRYVFVSDRDKGLDKSLAKTFPNNLAR